MAGQSWAGKPRASADASQEAIVENGYCTEDEIIPDESEVLL